MPSAPSPKPAFTPMTPEERVQFENIQRGYANLGKDLERDCDTWAQKWKQSFEKLGITYPVNGTLEEKWTALREGAIEARLEALVMEIRSYVGRIQAGAGPRPKKSFNPEKLEPMLREEEGKYPILKPLIDQVRAAIQELRSCL